MLRLTTTTVFVLLGLVLIALCACSPAPQCTTGNMVPVDTFWYDRASQTWIKDTRFPHFQCVQELHRSSL